MLTQASALLDRHDPAKTLISIGATAQGIDAVYELAKQKGFNTLGIVSMLVRDEHVTLATRGPDVLRRRQHMGGLVPRTDRLGRRRLSS